MENKRSRRIIEEVIGAKSIIDGNGYIGNKCSNNVRKILTTLESVEIEIYFDKHYFIRYIHGDVNGKRDGIEIETVQALILEATKHLFFYSVTFKTFSFVNYVSTGHPYRIVLTKLFKSEINFNVIVEYHYLRMQKFEVTLITAMRKHDFHFNDGTHQLQIQPDGSSILYKNERSKILSLGSCNDL